jgi:hypothetical protein
MTARPVVDDAIREYLVVRGFTTTLRAFETELRSDKVPCVVEEGGAMRPHP